MTDWLTLDAINGMTLRPAKRFDIRYFLPPLAEWRQRRQFRTDLRRLLKVGPHMIEDIGLDQEEAQDEITKPFWRA